VNSGVRVINASVTSSTENAVVQYAMSLLARERAILVAAAGNLGPSAPPVYPAAIPSALAVTAVSIKGDVYRNANTGDYIDISAPGIDLPTTSQEITSGTSLAVPFVTAAVAYMIHACNLSPSEAEARLEANARDLGPSGRDSSFGWGLLQAMPGCREANAGVAAPAD
jgi:subtilisin family serine protease